MWIHFKWDLDFEENVEGGSEIWKAVLSDGDNGGHDDDVDTEYEDFEDHEDFEDYEDEAKYSPSQKAN